MNTKTHLKLRGPQVIHETIDNEVVIIDLPAGNYFSLTSAGADIWSMLIRGIPHDAIVEALARRYEGSREEIESAADRLVGDLLRETLIVPAGADVPAGDAEGIMPAPGATAEPRPRFVPPALLKYTDMQHLLLLDPIHEVDETGWPNQKGEG
jgi:hypothetical protein